MTRDEVLEFLLDEGESLATIIGYLNFKDDIPISQNQDTDNSWLDMSAEDLRSDFDSFLLEIAYADLSPVQKFDAILA